jgi:hypothetical protein
MDADDYKRIHGQSGHTITSEGVESPALVYVAPELRLDPCPECGGKLRIVGRINSADGEPIASHTVSECEDCRTGVMSEDG